MGYTRYTTAVRLLQAIFSRGGKPWAPRAALTYALLISFAFSTLVSTASRSVAAEANDTTSHHMIGPDDMTGHDMTALDMTGQEPCHHGQDCKCHDRLMSHCCAQVSPVAAILTTLAPSPELPPQRCTAVHSRHLRSEGINPPTPPPRSVLA